MEYPELRRRAPPRHRGLVAARLGETPLRACGELRTRGVAALPALRAGHRVRPSHADAGVDGGKAGRLVAGFRGAPAADRAALVDLVLRLARLGEDIPAVAELDLNPVLALPDRCVAVDARIRASRPPRPTRAKTW